jgi:N-acetylglucosamine kinase-like BadF-type ATPase
VTGTGTAAVAGTAGTAGIPAVLAIDGGNSKTDLALVGADGTLLAEARGPGMQSPAELDEWLAMLDGLVARATQQAQAPGGLVARHLSACVANADLPEEEEALAAALRARRWSQSTTAVNDTFAVLRAGLDLAVLAGPGSGHDQDQGARTGSPGPVSPDSSRPWGVAVTCGAGINCVGVDPAGRTTGFLALGRISGDWDLGLATLWHAARAEDGRGPATALRAAVAGHFGLPSMREVTIGLHLGKIAEEAVHGLAPVLLAVAGDSDEVAGQLVRRLAGEVCAMALTAMRRLGLTGLATPVVLGGGVLTARDPLLTRLITEQITAAAPTAVVHIVTVPPVAGAALLGLDHVGAGADAERRLRVAYRERTGT